MPDKNRPSLSYESSEPAEQKLWDALGDLPRGEPSPAMRRNFYRELERASAPTLAERARRWLGLGSNAGWVTAAACILLGFGVARISIETPSSSTPGQERLAALEQNVALLNRELIMDRLQASAPSTRLAGIYQASTLVGQDTQIVQALLQRATQDRALSVRSAAIDALGPQLGNEPVGQELMKLLEEAQSPIVQLALVDLVLRFGTARQVTHLQQLAGDGHLFPDLAAHVNNSIRSQST